VFRKGELSLSPFWSEEKKGVHRPVDDIIAGCGAGTVSIDSGVHYVLCDKSALNLTYTLTSLGFDRVSLAAGPKGRNSPRDAR
jgi:hypothetical protein